MRLKIFQQLLQKETQGRRSFGHVAREHVGHFAELNGSATSAISATLKPPLSQHVIEALATERLAFSGPAELVTDSPVSSH